MAVFEILHGSDHIIKKPQLCLGKLNNDYGQGFYCTRDLSLAMEWACKNNQDGFVNKYQLDDSCLNTLNLLDGEHNILQWMALLLDNRTFRLSSEISKDVKKFILDNYLISTKRYDIIIGYRADDSYFSFAESFVQNGLSLNSLNKALKLGRLGEQIVLVSEKAFKKIKFTDYEIASGSIYYPKFCKRDYDARIEYKNKIKKSQTYKDDIFALDILREEMKNDDPRIQRIVY